MSPRLLFLFSAVSLIACAGGSWTVKKTGLDGKTTVTGDPESLARHEAQRRHRPTTRARSRPPPRAARPIHRSGRVRALRLEDLKKALNAQQANDAIVRELSAEPLFRVKTVGA